MTTSQLSDVQYPKTLLVAAHVRGMNTLLTMDESLDELERLAQTAGLEVVERITQTINRINPATFIGAGKVDEIVDRVKDTDIRTVIFDDELAPNHQRELNKRLGQDVNLLDRSALILDIFSQHASTREGALQVELAQYEYRLPRLTRQWTHLARQAGGGASRGGAAGVGLRGPGETQLEVDRREIQRKITRLQTDIEQVRQQREQRRNQRRKSGIPVVALVGYTNAGKSTLLNVLSDSDIYAADQLFATLDPTTRRVTLPSGQQALISDTVGFIQKLPTTLIAAFRGTLEEIAEADLLLHVVDASHPNRAEHIEAVEDTLAELDVPSIPRLMVWNKIDNLAEDAAMPTIERVEDEMMSEYFAEVHISSARQINIDSLQNTIESALSSKMVTANLLIPYTEGQIKSQLYEYGHVLDEQALAEGYRIEVELPPNLYQQYREYSV